MTAPGKNLDVLESMQYRRRVAPLPALGEQILRHVRAWPDTGCLAARGVRELEFKMERVTYRIFVRRVGQRLGLMNIFELPKEEAVRGRYVKELGRTFGSLT